jgi:hypothetical protein
LGFSGETPRIAKMFSSAGCLSPPIWKCVYCTTGWGRMSRIFVQPPIDMLIRICEFFQVSTDSLLGIGAVVFLWEILFCLELLLQILYLLH